MSHIGIVAEFNPFHTGHKYIIEYAKNNMNADSVVIALGNEFTQRGGVAIIDRYSRAAAAIDAGADLSKHACNSHLRQRTNLCRMRSLPA